MIKSQGENGKWRQGKLIISKVTGSNKYRIGHMVEKHEIILQPGTAILIEVEEL